MKLKRNFDEPICDIDGNPIRLGQTMEALLFAINAIWPRIPSGLQDEFNAALKTQNVDDAQLTLRIACVRALVGAYADEDNLAPEEAIKRMDLARKVNVGGIIEIEDTERDKMKALIRKRFGGVVIPVVAGELLEKDVPLGTM
jgi:hypothetical protein